VNPKRSFNDAFTKALFCVFARNSFKFDCFGPARLVCRRIGDCRQNYLKGALKMYGTFYLGKNPNGKFFVTNVAQSVAQQLADENGTEFHEIVDGKKLTLKKVELESSAEKPAEVEIKTLMVNGVAVKVQTSSQAENAPAGKSPGKLRSVVNFSLGNSSTHL